ncbi:sugar transferase [Parasphingorhabdus litoris]|uniref:sugar transferase n=1 Tax=Parasphingorhabdus litoris TaxID=394733 RepID=UPI001E3982F4|nr:sugar transferase [Parasphingorhabdus litoris]
MKRLFDLTLALLLLLPALALVVLAMLLIRLNTKGSSLFVQTRIGRNERPFQLYKLRTMTLGTPDRASHEISQSSVTPIGAFLRKTKIDELPQILSVLKGDMSFVGPRPCLPIQHELIAERSKRGVFQVRPGITGLAQISGVDMSEPVRLSIMDAEYIDASNFLFDAKILISTIAGSGRGDAVGLG